MVWKRGETRGGGHEIGGAIAAVQVRDAHGRFEGSEGDEVTDRGDT